MSKLTLIRRAMKRLRRIRLISKIHKTRPPCRNVGKVADCKRSRARQMQTKRANKSRFSRSAPVQSSMYNTPKTARIRVQQTIQISTMTL